MISPAETLLPRAFLYLSIESLASYEFFTEFITGLVEEYWKNIVKINASPVKDMMCLLKNCASVNKEVRAFAMKLLYYAPYSASAMFPSMFYSKEGLALCLDLFGALQLESTNEYSSSYPALYLPNSQEDLHLPCSRIAIKEILAFVEKYINDTLLKALCQDPRRVLSAYTFYVYHSNKLVKNAVNVKTFATTNFGISVLNQHYYSSKVVPLGNFHLLESYLFPEKFNLWFKQQRCEGSFLRDETILQMLGNYLSIADSLLVSKVKLQDMIERLKEYIMEDTAVVTHNTEIFDILGKTAGIMIITGETTCCSEVVQIPLNKSTIASITAAVYCWEWLIYSIPSIKSSICMELQLGWMGYISQVFLLQHQPFKKSLELIDYQVFQTENILTRLESMRMTINFIQKQIYTTTEDTNANKYLIRIIRDTLEQKMNPEVMNYEAGIEIFLQIIFITVDVIKFNLDETTADLSMKLLDFCISGFVAEHSWVKVSSMNKFNILKEKYEKCMEALKSLKVPNGSTTTVKEYYLNDPHTWQPRKQIEVFFASDQSKTTEGLYEYKKEILLIFIFHQYQRLIAWNSVFGSNCASSPKTGKKSKLVKKAWEISPNIGKIFGDIVKSHKTYEKSLSDSEEERKYLFTCPWKLPLIINALDSSNACERSYCLKLLHRSSERCKLYFMQQVLQCGHPTCKYEDYKRHIGEEDVWSFLTTNAMHSSVFLSQLIWMLEVSLYNPDADLSSTLGHNFHRIILKIISDDPEEWEKFNREQSYFNNFLQISADLIPKNPENFNIINEKLSELSSDIPQGIYIPTNPQRFVVGLRDDNGRPLQSAKRTPILITFYTKAHESDHAKSTQCIFKVNDDVRNDQLCLQIIELMREILSQTGLKIYLRPYKVISNITHTSQGAQLSGIIECIPNCKSRDEIGKEGTDSLYTYFLDKFGTENSDGYVEAKKNFIASLAGYAVASYLLQIKDRHNGNILIDEHGHIVHIDFGFILSISPGGNMRFERPGFKLTQEMIDIIGTNDSESFEFFKTLVAKGYLAVREQAHSFIALISRMEHSGLTCFRKNAVANFIKRFYLGSSLPDAIKKINEKISKANNSFFTLWYDRIQLMQQQIEY